MIAGVPRPIDVLAHELQAERAATLGRVASRMEAAIAAWREAPDDERFAEAAERVWYYIVQREALGWRDHRYALEAYDVPEELVRRMGLRRRQRSEGESERPGSAPRRR